MTAPHKRRRTWRWKIAPILRSPHTIEGMEILEELLPSTTEEVAGTLFLTIRDLLLWSATPKEDRNALFAGSHKQPNPSALPEALHAPLRHIHSLLLAPAPSSRTPIDRDLMTAALEIASWAGRENYGQTAEAFSRTAALLLPEDPQPSFQAATWALHNKEPIRATSWFQRSIGLARRTQRWDLYTRAYLELSRLTPHPETKEALLLRALRAARRRSLPTLLETIQREREQPPTATES